MTDTPETEPDDLEGCDEHDWARNKNATKNKDIDALVLFADVDFTDEAAVEARKAEYEALFRGSDA